MVHSSHKGAVDAEDTLDLGGMGELEFPVNIPAVFDGPLVRDIPVDAAAIRPELRPGLHLAEKEVCGIGLRGTRARKHFSSEFPRPFLFRHHKRHIFEERFVQLHDTLENVGFLG